MHTDTERSALDLLPARVIGCAQAVQNVLGTGFLEKVYENALLVEMRATGLAARQQVSYSVRYRDEIVGNYVADLVVGDAVIVETRHAVTLPWSTRCNA